MARKGENIFKRKDGRWEARYIHHYENGKAKYRYLYGKSYKDVKQRKLEELCKKEKGIEEKNELFFSEFALQWLAEIKPAVKESTYTRYYRIVVKYLLPATDRVLLQSVDTCFLNRMQLTLMERGGVNGGALAPKTVADILYVAKAVLRYGREIGIPCQNIGKLRGYRRNGHGVSVFPEDKRRKLEQNLLLSDDTLSLGILLTLFTGIRIGELCGLRWEDVDFTNETITICRTIERIANLNPDTPERTKVIISEPKTKNAVRNIPLPKFLIERLVKYRQPDKCYVLTKTEKYTEPHQFYVRYKNYLNRNGYGEYTFHALRHTFATRCVELGFDAKTLSEILGHASISTTLSFYVHPSVQQKKLQMERLTPLNIL